MTVFHKLKDIEQWAKSNPKPKDTSDWVNLIMSKPTKEERRQVLALVPETLRAHVAGRVQLEFEKMIKGKK